MGGGVGSVCCAIVGSSRSWLLFSYSEGRKVRMRGRGGRRQRRWRMSMVGEKANLSVIKVFKAA
jgi:hypothetical protein